MAAAISGRFEIAPRKANTFFVSVAGSSLPGSIFENHGDAAGSSDAGNGWRREGKGDAVGIHEQALLQVALDVFELLVFALACFPRLEGDKEEAGVGALHLGEKRKIGDRDDAFDSRAFSAARR